MSALLHIALTLIALALIVPAVTLFVEVASAARRRRPSAKASADNRPKLAVLVPARNEADGIEAAVESLLPQLVDHDRLIVVAHACHDATAELANNAGASVVELDDESLGKGHALDRGLQHLADDPPEVVVFFDADVVAHSNALDLLVQQVVARNRPAQAANLFAPPLEPSPLDLVSSFACLVRNVVRPEGLRRLGMPCQLTGSGMAFPWSLIRALPLAREHLVEDIQLGLDAALAGHPPTFCPDARVINRLPSAPDASASQRRRWEHGHLTTLFKRGPQLLRAALAQRRLDLLAMAMDLGIPPLSSLFVLTLAIFGASLLLGLLLGFWLPAWLTSASCALIAASITLTWVCYGRTTYPMRTLLVAPVYALRKLPMYFSFLIRRQKSWDHSTREAETELIANDSTDTQ